MSTINAAPVVAFPMVTAAPNSSTTATPTSPGTLPFDSSVIFVLDDPISSTGSKANQLVRAHLKTPLVVNGVTVAPAGTPAQIRILTAQAAQAGDVYGYVDIYFMPMQLPSGQTLPLRAPTSHLTVHVTTGHEATVSTEDTIADVIIPAHTIYELFRKGRNFYLAPGAEIRARTQATVSTLHGAVVVATPRPLTLEDDTPAVTFTAAPFATPKPNVTPGSMAAPTLGPDPRHPNTTPNPGSTY